MMEKCCRSSSSTSPAYLAFSEAAARRSSERFSGTLTSPPGHHQVRAEAGFQPQHSAVHPHVIPGERGGGALQSGQDGVVPHVAAEEKCYMKRDVFGVFQSVSETTTATKHHLISS